MSLGPIIGGLTVLASFGVLLANNGTQAGRNAAAQAELARTYPVPAFSQQVNQQIAAADQAKTAAPVKADSVALHTVAFDFPTSDREFPPGPGTELVTATCTSCHSAGMILTQPALNKATWLGEVNKMRSTYKATIADEDIEPIATYLAGLSLEK